MVYTELKYSKVTALFKRKVKQWLTLDLENLMAHAVISKIANKNVINKNRTQGQIRRKRGMIKIQKAAGEKKQRTDSTGRQYRQHSKI